MENYINENGEYYNSFIYRWFDRKLNKFYIGSHYGNANDGYLFGGIDIKKEYKERPNDFEREILAYHLVSEYSEIRKIEKEYLIKYDVENNDMFYNRTNESYGGYHKKSVENRLNDIDENGLNHFQRAAVKMVKTRKEKDSYKSAKVKEHITKIDRMDDIKIKISETLLGSRWVIKNNEIKYIKEEEVKEYLKNDWVFGNNIHLDKKWISKDLEQKYVKNIELDKYLENGWKLGRYHNLTLLEYSEISKKNKITSRLKWFEFAKSNNLLINVHRLENWIDWYIFLGKEKRK
jgi:hypothetical protein